MTFIEKHGLPRSGSACRTAPAPSSNWRRSALASPLACGKRKSLRRLCALAVLPVEMPVLRFQQPCPACADRRGTLCARLCARDRNHGGACARRTVTSIFLGGGTPSLMQPQTVGAILDAIGKHWRVAPDVEVTLEANPDQRRSYAVSRLSHRRRQSRLARRAGARRRLAEGAGTAAHRARGAGCGRDRAHRVRPLFVRPDLRPPRPDAADVGR